MKTNQDYEERLYSDAYDYWHFVQQILILESTDRLNFYNLDWRRTELHDELCATLGVTKAASKDITDNLDGYQCFDDFFDALKKLKKKDMQ